MSIVDWESQDATQPRTLRGFLRQRGWRGPVGPDQRAIWNALRKFVRREQETFTLEDVMEEAGLKFDSYSDRTAAASFLKRMREVIVEASEWFWTQPEYQKYVDDGFTDKTVFRKMVEALASYDIYPIQYDREAKKYALITLEGWVRIVHMRAIAIRNEFVRRAEDLALMSSKFEALKEMVTPPALPTDGKFIELPGPRSYRCGKCHMAFVDQESLEDHKQRRHPKTES